MTIAQRINLHRCGYSKEEIAELAAQEKEELEEVDGEPVEDPEPEKQPQNNGNAEVLKALTDLTKAIQQANINHSEQPPAPPDNTLSDILNEL